MRWRYLFTPITADESGYLAEARAWGRGATLYRDVWVDRPQGLMLLFRIWNDVGLGSPIGVRILALVACLGGAAAAGTIARRLVEQRSAWMAALAVGVLTSIPQAEGFIANAELLSCALGIVALSMMLRAFWDRDEPSLRGLFLAGLVGGAALSIKQSGFDALGAGLVLLAVACMGRRWSGRTRLLAVPAALAGVFVPIALLMIHGAITGWHRWWYAFAGYRLDQRSAVKNANWEMYHETSALLMPKLWAAIVLGLLAMLWGVRRARVRAASLLVLWCALAILAFLMGGQFFRHYWVIVGFPLGTAVATFVSALRERVVRLTMLGAALLVPMLSVINSWTIPRSLVGERLSGDVRLIKAEHIGEWFEAKKRPGENIIGLCAGAPLYGNVSTDPPYPYLWFALIPQVPGAHAKLVDLMTGPDAPTYVAEFQPLKLCDWTGQIRESIANRYRALGTIDGIVLYRRK